MTEDQSITKCNNDIISILVVDDDPDILFGTTRLLRSAGYAVFEANTGIAGLKAAYEKVPDLVLLDMELPDIIGYEVCRQIKTNKEMLHSYVVIISGKMISPDNQSEGLETGADGYLTRPISNRELLAHVQAVGRIIRAERKLRQLKAKHEIQSEKRHLSILKTAMDGFWITDTKGRLLEVNDSYCKMTGYREDELLTMSISDLEVVENPSDVAMHMQKILGQGFDRFESKHRRKDGTTFDVEVSVQIRNDDDGGCVCFLRDISGHKQSEKALHRKQSMLARTEKIAQVGSWEWDVATDTVTWSDELFRLFQLEPAERAPSFAKQDELFHPEDMARLRSAVEAAVNEGTPYELELRALRKDGTTRLCLARGQVDAAEGDRATRLVGSLQDITERNRAEEAVKETSLRLLLATKAGGVGIWEYDVADNRLQWEEQMYALYGISSETFGGAYESWRAGVHPEDIARVDREVEMALRGEKEFNTEFRVIWPDSTERHIKALATVLRDADGKPFRMIGTNWDITERKRAEEALRESEERFRSYFNLPLIGFAITSLEKGWIEVNERLCEILGYPREELVTLTWTAITHPEDIERDVAQFNLILEGMSEGYSLDKRFIRKDGSVIHGSISVCCVRKPDRTINYFVALVQDITDRKQAEAEREKLQAQLQQAQKMEAIGTLAGGIAHDFNNILGAIIGYAEIASDCIPPESIAIDHLTKVQVAGQRAANLVKQILAFSRQANIERIPLKPGSLVKEAIKLLRPSLPSTITIEQEIDSSNSSILADPTQLHQILMNLCTNAFHSMEQAGGILVIILKDCELSKDDLQHQPQVQPGTFVMLSIGDTGSGIAPEIRGKIFEPYFTTKEIEKGTGMGLAITHGIINSYGGFITCESQIGKGTVFRVFFPAIDENIVSEATAIEVAPSGTERILFVDDEIILVELGKTLLERLGYEVTAMTSSMEALSIFQSQPDMFDAIITDQTMPGMTGMDLAKQMLQIRSDIPIIICTGHSTFVNEEQAKAAGIKGFAMKPLSKNVIATLLRNVLDEGRTERLID